MVLNALTGAFIPAGLRLLREGGHFLEMGKAELWDAARLAAYPGVSYRAFDLVELDPERLGAMLREIMAAIERRELRPLPRKVFSISSAVEAFRFMSQARHLGKVVLSPRPVFDPEARYLITGGAG